MRLSHGSADKWCGWFKDEQLTSEEMDNIATEIEGKSVDMVLTHTCPISWEPTDLFLKSVDQSSVDATMEKWFESIKDNFDWSIWLFGHFHADRLVRPGVEMFYNDIDDLDNIWHRQSIGEPDPIMEIDPNYYSGV